NGRPSVSGATVNTWQELEYLLDVVSNSLDRQRPDRVSQIEAPEIHHGKRLSCTSVAIRSCEHHTGGSTIGHSNFEGEHPRGGQGLPTSLSLPSASREDLRFDGYLEYPMPQRHYTFTNTHAASGIRTQALRYSSQHH
ncbi:hypothetical protein TNCV_3764881, partial [Trichonephila clavipes]